MFLGSIKLPFPKNPGVGSVLLAAMLFGASTPFAKQLVEQVSPVALAGLLYLGAGIGLSGWLVLRRLNTRKGVHEEAPLGWQDLPWLTGAIFFGGFLGPVLLMAGLTLMPASSVSLLLNLEGVFTALLAWFVFKENFDWRILLGMALIVVASILLSWKGRLVVGVPWGMLAIAGACLCWAIDNNLTRKVSAGDPLQIACLKGLVAGPVNLGMAFLAGFAVPDWQPVAAAGVVGFLGYGLSLVLYVVALRHIGTARTGAYFSLAPFIGAGVGLLLLQETAGLLFWGAAILMGAGLWLHLTERHEHSHHHEAMGHTHRHAHDEHHRHEHDFPWDGREPHAHYHWHASQWHSHSHYPDTHHRHQH